MKSQRQYTSNSRSVSSHGVFKQDLVIAAKNKYLITLYENYNKIFCAIRLLQQKPAHKRWALDAKMVAAFEKDMNTGSYEFKFLQAALKTNVSRTAVFVGIVVCIASIYILSINEEEKQRYSSPIRYMEQSAVLSFKLILAASAGMLAACGFEGLTDVRSVDVYQLQKDIVDLKSSLTRLSKYFPNKSNFDSYIKNLMNTCYQESQIESEIMSPTISYY